MCKQLRQERKKKEKHFANLFNSIWTPHWLATLLCRRSSVLRAAAADGAVGEKEEKLRVQRTMEAVEMAMCVRMRVWGGGRGRCRWRRWAAPTDVSAHVSFARPCLAPQIVDAEARSEREIKTQWRHDCRGLRGSCLTIEVWRVRALRTLHGSSSVKSRALLMMMMMCCVICTQLTFLRFSFSHPHPLRWRRCCVV